MICRWCKGDIYKHGQYWLNALRGSLCTSTSGHEPSSDPFTRADTQIHTVGFKPLMNKTEPSSAAPVSQEPSDRSSLVNQGNPWGVSMKGRKPASQEHSEQCACEDCTGRNRLVNASQEPKSIDELAQAEMAEGIYDITEAETPWRAPEIKSFGVTNQALTQSQTPRPEMLPKLKEAQAMLEYDRTKIAEFITRLKKTLDGYDWLITGRGSYSWDDDRWHDEFRRASESIREDLEPLERIAADWHNCPTKAEDIKAAREAATVPQEPSADISVAEIEQLINCVHIGINKNFNAHPGFNHDSCIACLVGKKLQSPVAPRTQPQPPKGRDWLELNFEYDKSGRGYIDRDKGKLHTTGDVLDKFAAQFFLPAPPQPWISVKERLPEAGSTVILCVESEPDSQDIISIVKRNYLGARDNADHDDIIGRGYTHWKELDAQPLPTPPEQGQPEEQK